MALPSTLSSAPLHWGPKGRESHTQSKGHPGASTLLPLTHQAGASIPPPLATPLSSPLPSLRPLHLPCFSLGITPWSQSPFLLLGLGHSLLFFLSFSLCLSLLLSASLPLSLALRSPSQPPLWPVTGTRPSETPPTPTPRVKTFSSGSDGWGARQDKAFLRRSASGGPPKTAPRLQQGPPGSDTSPGFPTRAPAPRPPPHRSPRPPHYAPPLMGVCQRDFPASCFRGHQS